ncbi:MAG: DUF1294 domain-containing protein [Chloroflexota bacterium]
MTYVVITAGTFDLLVETVCRDNAELLTFLAGSRRIRAWSTETFVYLRIAKRASTGAPDDRSGRALTHGHRPGLADPRNRPCIVGSVVAGVALFLVLWLALRWSPLLAWMAGWTPVAFAAYGIDKRSAVRGGWRIPEWCSTPSRSSAAWWARGPGAWSSIKTQHRRSSMVLVVASVLWGAIVALAVLGRV